MHTRRLIRTWELRIKFYQIESSNLGVTRERHAPTGRG